MSAEILIVGAGPVGLALACELARHGVRPRIIDRRTEPLPFCRAIGVTPRTLEVYDDMGLAREMIDAGLFLTGVRSSVPGKPPVDRAPDLADLPFSQLGVPQPETERVLAGRLAALGITVERGVTLTGLDQDAGGARVTLEGSGGGGPTRFRYVVGCDGAHSAVRRLSGIAFEGETWPFDFMLGDVAIDWGAEPLARGLARFAVVPAEDAPPDIFVAIPLPERGRYRVSMRAPERLAAPAGSGTDHGIQSDRPDATLADLQEVADRLLSPPVRLSDPRWTSIFRISMRLAARYRVGNAFIAGDAAHVHPPTGGQGMNTGIQDAYNLAWKLALVVKGQAAPALLDSYEAERQPVALEVINRTVEASVNFGKRVAQDRLADTQILVGYRGGPLAAGAEGDGVRAGDRMPDAQGLRRFGIGFPLRLHEVLRGTAPVLLLAGGDPAMAEAAAARLGARWPGLVRVVALVGGEAAMEEPPGVELLYDAAGMSAAALGPLDGGAFLVRPDNYVGLRQKRFDPDAVLAWLAGTLGLI
ncbi:FAD-dependent monooxygenase [Ancylobacter terrae]|uniref:FAD-dependent monooxygenase n=1 Tax=Ancylobacter sp. sgz301288 TaxID=3342077 RepID=UPI00385F3BE5